MRLTCAPTQQGYELLLGAAVEVESEKLALKVQGDLAKQKRERANAMRAQLSKFQQLTSANEEEMTMLGAQMRTSYHHLFDQNAHHLGSTVFPSHHQMGADRAYCRSDEEHALEAYTAASVVYDEGEDDVLQRHVLAQAGTLCTRARGRVE
jgi:hypothetical protein